MDFVYAIAVQITKVINVMSFVWCGSRPESSRISFWQNEMGLDKGGSGKGTVVNFEARRCETAKHSLAQTHFKLGAAELWMGYIYFRDYFRKKIHCGCRWLSEKNSNPIETLWVCVIVCMLDGNEEETENEMRRYLPLFLYIFLNLKTISEQKHWFTDDV